MNIPLALEVVVKVMEITKSLIAIGIEVSELKSNYSTEERRMKKIIRSGGQKRDGGHDHRSNSGNDRTPSQKRGDKGRRK